MVTVSTFTLQFAVFEGDSAYGRVETLPFFCACPLYVYFFADKFIFVILGVKKDDSNFL